MKKLLGIVVLGLFLTSNAYSKELKDIIFANSAPEKQLLCVRAKTQEISMWNFHNIKDEILGNYTYIVPFGVIKNKDGKPDILNPIRSTPTFLDINYSPAIAWTQLFYNKNDFTIDKITFFFGKPSKEIEEENFWVTSSNYNLKQNDKEFINSLKVKLKSARENYSKLNNPDNIDARNQLIASMDISKRIMKKRYDMSNDESYTKKDILYRCMFKNL